MKLDPELQSDIEPHTNFTKRFTKEKGYVFSIDLKTFSFGAVLMKCGKLFLSVSEECENERWPYDQV